jgi:hypothetical protein
MMSLAHREVTQNRGESAARKTLAAHCSLLNFNGDIRKLIKSNLETNNLKQKLFPNIRKRSQELSILKG